jgi:ParB family chromosome partitioning protein
MTVGQTATSARSISKRNGNGSLVSRDVTTGAKIFLEKVDAIVSNEASVGDSLKALRAGDGLLKLANDLHATRDAINTIQAGRFKLTAYIGKAMPAKPPEERGAMGGKGNKAIPSDGTALPFSKNTLTNYRKVAANAERIDEYFEANKEVDEPVSVIDFIRFATGTEKAGTAAHVSKNTGVPEWYTPKEYIEAAREVLGEIELDPATSKIAQKVVGAETFYAVDDDGLKQDWRGKVWMNPPYTSDLVTAFTEKLCGHFPADVPEAIVLVNNATETKWFQKLANVASAICFPSGRVKFLDEDGKPGAPLQGQAVIYLGKDAKAFCESFTKFGFVLIR